MRTSTRLAIAAGVLAFAGFSTAAMAASPNGTWTRPTGGKIQVFNCGGGIGMKVVKSATPAHVGKRIMCGAKPNGGNSWKGSLLNLEDGNTYTGILTLNGSSLKLSGCVLGGLICKNETWTK